MARYKSIILMILVIAIVYSVIVIVVSPFLISWGDKPNIFGRIINFLMTFPINWKLLITEKSLFYVFPNGLFWGCLVTAVIYVTRKIF